MIILPDRTQPRGRILMPMRLRDWSPSIEHGHVPVHRWCVRARVSDGAIVRELWFDDREEADAFLLSRIMGTPWPHYEELEYPATWQIFANVTLTGTLASNQTYNVPADYVQSGSTWTVIATGASGGLSFGAASGRGSGGGACSRQTNVALTPTGTATYRVEAGPVGATGGTGAQGVAGFDCWFGGTTLAGSVVGAKGGVGSVFSGAEGAGGAAASGIGAVKFSGGRGGSTGLQTGGGGAAGPSADGVNGVDAVGPTAGGAGNGGAGGAGGAAGAAGGNGTEIVGGLGSGGGGGSSSSGNGFNGGLYGGGGGSGTGGNTSGAGAQGVVLGVYSPAASGSGLQFNAAMMGL